MRFSWIGALIGGFIFLVIWAYTCMWELRPGKIAVVTQVNGQTYVEDRVGLHWTVNHPVIFDKQVLIEAKAEREDESVRGHFERTTEPVNRSEDLVRIIN